MPHAPDLSGTALDGRYELHSLIGEGTFGRVYRGRDRRLARPVAVKVIKPWWAEDPEWVRSFEREAQLLASISAPGIVQIFDVGSAPEGLYYVTELVEGQSLVHRLQGGRIAAGEACEIGEQLARALARAHDQRVVHRDVKPANVLIAVDGQVKVTDFGVARLAEGSTDGGVGTIVGTPRYMAPEQASGGSATPATDVYGVGVVLYEMLAGRPPFDGGSAVELAFRHVHEAPPPLPRDVPARVGAIVVCALAKDAAERFADGRALAAALAGVQSEIEFDELDAEIAHTARAVTGAGATRAPATALLEPPPSRREPAAQPPADENPETRVAAPFSARRNVNPSGRRRRIALLGAVVLLGLGMIAATIALAPGYVRVPNLRGLTRSRAGAVVRHAGLRASYRRRFSGRPKGVVVDQSPRRGARVRDGSLVSVTLSAGPAPVDVPDVVGTSSSNALTLLMHEKLRTELLQVPAPGVPVGQVTRQTPSSGAKVAPGSVVRLRVAEAPRWRGLTSFTGTAQERSVPFRIRGTHWRILYSMGYRGTCTLIFICSGPSATVTNLTTGATVRTFDLDEGAGRVWTFTSGSGVYQVAISPGSDNAAWSVQAQDYY